jgi:hypothetical protein
MKIKFVYISTTCNLQFGKIVSVRAETQSESDFLTCPSSVFNPDNIGIGDLCDITEWIDTDIDTLTAIFERGEKTINVNGQLCDVVDIERNTEYLASLEKEAESEASNG